MRRNLPILLVLYFVWSSMAAAAGYGPWTFGMTKQDVRAITQHGPYYEFRNGDLGSKNGSVDGAQAPISFYFKNERLVRVMIVLYAGPNFKETQEAWRSAFQHIERYFKSAEVAAVQHGPTDLASAERALENSGLREGRAMLPT